MDEKYFCRTCKGRRNHKSLFKKRNTGGFDDDLPFHWIEEFEVIECLGCETVSFLKTYGNSEMIEQDENGDFEYYFDKQIFPLYLDSFDSLRYTYYLPANIRQIYEEAVAAFKIEAYILTAGGLRAIIEALCNHLEIKQGNLSNRIDLLYKKSFLTLSESKRLHSIRFLGNDALHEIEAPKKEHLVLLFEIINHLLSNLFINDKIIDGQVETIVDSYIDFIRLIRTSIIKSKIDTETKISEILGRSRRRIPNEKYNEFINMLINDTKTKKIDFLEIIIENNSESVFKIVNKPDDEFPF